MKIVLILMLWSYSGAGGTLTRTFSNEQVCIAAGEAAVKAWKSIGGSYGRDATFVCVAER